MPAGSPHPKSYTVIAVFNLSGIACKQQIRWNERTFKLVSCTSRSASQLVASMNAATTVGRHPLSSRFTATVRIGVLDYPDGSELCSVYSAFLGKALDINSHNSRCERRRANWECRKRMRTHVWVGVNAVQTAGAGCGVSITLIRWYYFRNLPSPCVGALLDDYVYVLLCCLLPGVPMHTTREAFSYCLFVHCKGVVR